MSILGSLFIKKQKVKDEFPELFWAYELITSNNPYT